MITEELLLNIFEKEVHQLGSDSGLSEDEQTRIIEVFKVAMKNPYMDERLIFPALIGVERAIS